MKTSHNFNSHKRYDGLVEVNLCSAPTECPECSFLINKRNGDVVNKLLEEHQDNFPVETTRIIATIIPSERNIKNYSFSGIENVLKSLFKIEPIEVEKEIRKLDVYFKAFYIKDDFYTIPSIRFEVIFMDRVSEETYAYLNNFIQSKLVSIIGSPGIIERKKLTNSNNFSEYFNIPLLLGNPEFTYEGIYEKKGFTEKQLEEMNFLHSFPITKINLQHALDYNNPKIFDDMRMLIYKTNVDKEETERIREELKQVIMQTGLEIELRDGEWEDIAFLLKKEASNTEDDEVDELPF